MPKDNKHWETWGDVFLAYLSRGHDHGSAAYAADKWEMREANRKGTPNAD